MENPKELKYSKEHEWIKIENDVITVGITDFAQHALTDVVFVELPEIGKKVEHRKAAAVIESVKSVSDIYAPVTGEIVEVNTNLNETPEKVNKDPYGEGWMFKIKLTDNGQLNNLMSSEEYTEMTAEKKE